MTIIFPSHKSLYKDHRNFDFITYISTNELEQHNTCMYEKKRIGKENTNWHKPPSFYVLLERVCQLF